jgi:hypothetical protein
MSSTSSPLSYEPLSAADLDQLIAEVAKQHGFLLDRHDPVLVTVSLNRQVLAQIVAQIGEAAVAAKLEIAAGAARQADVAKAEASRLITAAAEYADEQFRLAAASAAEELKAGLSKQLTELPVVADTERLARTASSMRWTAAFVYLAATLTALVTIVTPLVSSSSPETANCLFQSHRAVQR